MKEMNMSSGERVETGEMKRMESPEKQELNDATHEPEALIEQRGDFQQAESILDAFTELTDTLSKEDDFTEPHADAKEAQDISAGALMHQAISELARSSVRDMQDVQEGKAATEQQKIEAKKGAIDAQAAETEAKRKAAGEALAASSVSARIEITGAASNTEQSIKPISESSQPTPNLEDISAGALMHQAISEMARSSVRDMQDAQEGKAATEQQKIEAKKGAIDAQSAETEAKREAAGEALAASSVSARIEITGAASNTEQSIKPISKTPQPTPNLEDISVDREQSQRTDEPVERADGDGGKEDDEDT